MPQLLDDTFGVVLGPTDMLVMPGDPGDPYWNAGCIPVPSTYTFDRMGQSTVSFSGQTARLQMAIELYGAFSTGSEAELLAMYNDGVGFSDPYLDASGKKLGNKTENGKKMFIYQAAEAFKIWHNIQPEINEEVSKLLDND